MKIIISGILALGLFFTGCSSKQDVATNDTAKKEVETQKEAVNDNLEKQKGQISEQIVDEGGKHNPILLVHSIYFDFDKFNIKNSMKDISHENVNLVKNHLSSDANAVVTLEGNCDNVGTDEYNYALGLKRAKSVKDTLTNSGVDVANIVIKSLGESSPVCKEDTTDCRAKNRRVDYIINK